MQLSSLVRHWLLLVSLAPAPLLLVLLRLAGPGLLEERSHLRIRRVRLRELQLARSKLGLQLVDLLHLLLEQRLLLLVGLEVVLICWKLEGQ